MKKFLLLLLSVVSVLGIIFSSCGKKKEETIATVERGSSSQTTAPVKSNSVDFKVPLSAILIADFNGERINNIGGTWGAWDKDPNDPTQSASESLDSANKVGNSGNSLKIDYDVESPNPAYNGFWMKLNRLGVKGRKNICFFIKGDSSKGYTKKLKVEIKNSHGQKWSEYINNISDSWQKIVLPFKKLNVPQDTSLDEFVLVFEDMTATKKVGTIYIDNVFIE